MPARVSAPDSPRASQSPPPVGIQGDLELELMSLANALYNLGTTVVNDSTKEKDKPGSGKQVGLRVNEVIDHLATIDNMSQHIRTLVPMQILTDIDNGRNPMHLTKDRLERAATENQFMNGKIAAVRVQLLSMLPFTRELIRFKSYRTLLDEAIVQTFPELADHVTSSSSHSSSISSVPPAGDPHPLLQV
ncbi:hypothetical protein BV25DRAFT_1826429 [Artomyces pyxidatus]|uniref:Uncharacterized protein n=1 Tax=Artomyces pyxidatus TaxID=48021 RepID=A0ACB8T0S3_9AGAM|nr:hypothetical protein BV25DRAFT_1826429 [Artomyces pyxidatus]